MYKIALETGNYKHLFSKTKLILIFEDCLEKNLGLNASIFHIT